MNTNNHTLYGFTLVTSQFDHRIEEETFHHSASHMVHYHDALDQKYITRSTRQSRDYVAAQQEGPLQLKRFIVDNPGSILDESGLVTKLLAENPTIPENLQQSLRIKYDIAQSEVQRALEVYTKAQ